MVLPREEPRRDDCEFCGHKWHGLPCKHKKWSVDSMDNTVISGDCGCPTAFVDRYETESA